MTLHRLVVAASDGPGWFPKRFISQDGQDVDPSLFTQCEYYQGGPIEIAEVEEWGYRPPIAFGALDIPIVSKPVAEVLERSCSLDALQLIPTGYGAGDEAYVANVLRKVDCLDQRRTEGMRAPMEADGSPGDFQVIFRLFVDESRVNQEPLFRIRGWTIPLIVSDTLADSLRPFLRGVGLLEVS